MTSRRVAAAAVLLAALAALTAGPARAGVYPVYSCEPAVRDVNNSWVASRDTWMLLAYANCPPGNEPKERARGLVTQSMENVAAPNTAMQLYNHAALTFRAPPGASLARVTYMPSFCGNGGFRVGLANAADQWLDYSGPGFCGSFEPGPKTLDLRSTWALRLYTMCAQLSCRMGSTVAAWATLRSATVWVEDFTQPTVSGAGPLAASSWVRGTVPATVVAGDNVGIQEVQVWLDDKRVASDAYPCDYTYVVPCATAGGPLAVNTRTVDDGPQWVAFVAIDSAGNHKDATYRVYVDNTPPAAPRELRITGGDDWRATNDFALEWANPPQGGASPIAGVRFGVCPVTTAPESLAGCKTGSRGGSGLTGVPGITVPSQGEWFARAWLADAAGNENMLAAGQVRLRYDGTPPEATLAEVDPQDPQRVTLIARDAVSGIAGGDIEIRRQGSAGWIGLPVQPAAAGLTALVDDATLPDGVYDVRARVVDRAGNERSTTTRTSGAVAHLVLPLRIPTALRAGRPLTIRGLHGRRRTVLARTATTPFGSSVRVRGRLAVPGGNPLAGADVDVLERTDLPDQPWVRAGITRTDARGRFRYRVLPGPSRTVLFRYAGTPLIRSRTAAVRVRVRALTSLAVSRRAVVNGEDVVFRGRVHGAPMPATGKLVQLQAYSRGGWRTFANPRARASTRRWAYRYRFTATRGSVRYRFRAVVPAEGGFPFARGASRSVSVNVRGL
jgi:hypothetical protein